MAQLCQGSQCLSGRGSRSTRQALTSLLALQGLLCPEHKEEVTHYCKTCQRLVCQLCRVRRTHTSHKITPVLSAYQALRVRGSGCFSWCKQGEKEQSAPILPTCCTWAPLDSTWGSPFKPTNCGCTTYQASSGPGASQQLLPGRFCPCHLFPGRFCPCHSPLLSAPMQEKLTKSLAYILSNQDMVQLQIVELEETVKHTEVRGTAGAGWSSLCLVPWEGGTACAWPHADLALLWPQANGSQAREEVSHLIQGLCTVLEEKRATLLQAVEECQQERLTSLHTQIREHQAMLENSGMVGYAQEVLKETDQPCFVQAAKQLHHRYWIWLPTTTLAAVGDAP